MLVSSTSCIEVKNPEDQEKDYDNYYYSEKRKTMTAINNNHKLSKQADMHRVASTSKLAVWSWCGHLSSDYENSLKFIL